MRLLLLLLLFFCQYANSQDLSITVTDKSGKTLSGATVVLSSRDGIQRALQTDDKGVCKFDGLTAGTYIVKAEAKGFRALVKPVRLEAALQETLELRPEGVYEEVIVTANNTPQTTDELSKSASSVTLQEIDERIEYSVAETLRLLPGFRVRIFGGPGGFTSIRLRGLFTENTSILIDGMRLRDASDFRGSANSLSDVLFVNNVGRIEVLRGSGSSLYGTNAVGGVVNIVPYVGIGDLNGEVSFEGGGLGFFREALRLSGGIERLSYSLAAARTDTLDGIDGQDRFKDTSVSANMRYFPSNSVQLSAVFNYNRSSFQLNDSPFPIGPAGNEFGYAKGTGSIVGFVPDLNDPDAFRRTQLFQGSLMLRHRLSSAVSYFMGFGAVDANRRFIDGPEAAPQLVDLITRAQGFYPRSTSDSRFEGRTLTFTSGANFQLDEHNFFTIGFEAEKERLTQLTSFFGRESFSQNTYGLYLQNQSSYLADRLRLAFSGRIQGFDLNLPQSLPGIPSADLEKLRNIKVPRAYIGDVALSYSFGTTRLRMHVGNSFRAPSLSERFSAFDSKFNPVRIGNPFLRPERVLSAEAGIDQSALQNRLRLGLTYFYNRRQEIITGGFVLFSPSAGAAFFQTNTPGGLARGIEATMLANVTRSLDVSASYLYSNSEQVFRGIKADGTRVSGSTRAFSNPRHIFNLVVNQRWRRLNVNFDLNAISDYDNPVFTPGELFIGFASPIFTFDGYVKADLAASYNLPLSERQSLELFVKVTNLFDDDYVEDGFRAPGAFATAGLKFRF
ncbi:MAG: TonB-dependent receptor [Acidobacteriota bacterium]|nr:TonB-dependent receptor [Blastocatellia bacterium]MDW8411370.1 TonB-dependent receptor [Acidobacteriota bacterium]